MTARDRLAQLLGPQALLELDVDVAAAPPLPDRVRAELMAVAATELNQPRPDQRAA